MKSQFRMSRRELLAVSAFAGFGALLPQRLLALGEMTIGEAKLSIVSDGNLILPMSFAYPDAPQDELKALLEGARLATDALVPDCNVTILQSGDRTAIFDVGSGANFMPSAGKLLENLAEAGVSPEDITDVIFTHAHPDHLWGLLDEFDEVIFPEAAFHINKTEWDFWTSPDTLANMPEERKTFVVGAQSRLAVLEDTINLFAYGDEVIPGVEAVDTNGHTPGHTSFAVHSGSESVMVIGDAITNVPVSFAQPGWPSGSDQDADQGAKSRTMLLDRLVTDKMAAIGYHFPHPGSCRVEKDGTAFRYVAEA